MNLPDVGWLIAYAGWVVASTLFLLLDRRPPVTTLAWLIGFWGVPWLVVPLYILVGPRRLSKQRNRRQRARSAASSHSPDSSISLSSRFIRATPYHALARVTQVSGEASAPPRQASHVSLYEDGDAAYPDMEAAMEAARSTVHVGVYVFKPDEVGTRWRDLLARKASEGIEVRLLVDAIGAKDCDDSWWAPLIDAGGTVKIFNPVSRLLSGAGRLNFRCHRKIVVIDGVVGFTGGINVSDNNVTRGGSSPWRNTHMRIDGEPAHDLQTVFLIDWLYGDCIAEDRDDHRSLVDRSGHPDDSPIADSEIAHWFPEFEPAQGPWVQIIDSGPDEPTHDIHQLFFSAINAAKDRIWLTTPYFVPDEAIHAAIRSSAARGVDVRILIPRVSDHKVIDKAALTFTEELSRDGAQIWCYESGMNHSKTLLIDDEVSIVGTANMDNRSFRLNFEVVSLVIDKALAAELSKLFEKDLEESSRISFDTQDDLKERLLKNASRLLAPLL